MIIIMIIIMTVLWIIIKITLRLGLSLGLAPLSTKKPQSTRENDPQAVTGEHVSPAAPHGEQCSPAAPGWVSPAPHPPAHIPALHSFLGTYKLISNHCADYGLQDYGLHWEQFGWLDVDYGLRGGGGCSG